MTEKLVLVTGACGEIGQALIQGLARKGGYRIVTSDLAPLPDSIKNLSAEHVQGDLVYNGNNVVAFVPEALKDGKPLRGKVRQEFISDKKGVLSMPVSASFMLST